jgi:hypothetical protein
VSDDAIVANQITNETRACEISDDALENSASIGQAGNYTLYFRTALDLCPAA